MSNQKISVWRKDIGDRCQWVYWQFSGGRGLGTGLSGMGRRAENQQPEIFAGCTHSFAVLDFTDSDRLAGQLEEQKRLYGKWDYIIHCAGVTKCLDKADFEIGNYWATRHFIETLKRLDMLPVNFIYISSLSIFGPIREKDYTPICEEDTPRPNTAYGLSKLHTEEYLKSLSGFPYVISVLPACTGLGSEIIS